MVSATATVLLLALLTFCLGILYHRRDSAGLGSFVCYIVGIQLMAVAIILVLLIIIDSE